MLHTFIAAEDLEELDGAETSPLDIGILGWEILRRKTS